MASSVIAAAASDAVTPDRWMSPPNRRASAPAAAICTAVASVTPCKVFMVRSSGRPTSAPHWNALNAPTNGAAIAAAAPTVSTPAIPAFIAIPAADPAAPDICARPVAPPRPRSMTPANPAPDPPPLLSAFDSIACCNFADDDATSRLAVAMLRVSCATFRRAVANRSSAIVMRSASPDLRTVFSCASAARTRPDASAARSIARVRPSIAFDFAAVACSIDLSRAIAADAAFVNALPASAPDRPNARFMSELRRPSIPRKDGITGNV